MGNRQPLSRSGKIAIIIIVSLLVLGGMGYGIYYAIHWEKNYQNRQSSNSGLGDERNLDKG